MSKTQPTFGHATYSFYRPHKRHGEDGLIFNNLTGEYERPPSMTKQEFKAECDINNIVKHFKPHEMAAVIAQNMALGVYGELPGDHDYQDAIHLVRQAEDAFMTLPSKVRDRFGQDPAQFLAFASNPDNLAELRELGLANPVPAAPPPVRVIIEPPQAPSSAPGSSPANGPGNGQPGGQ